MDNKKKERVISAKKYRKNIKKYWWIGLIVIVLMVLLVLNNVKKSSVTVDQSDNSYYGAWTYINVETTNDMMKNICLLSTATDNITELNKSLSENGYSQISKDDYISVVISSAKYITVSAYGKGNPERIEYISKRLTEISIDMAKTKLSVAKISIEGDTTVFNASKTNNTTYVRLYGSVDNQNSDTGVLKQLMTAANAIIIVACVIIWLVIIFIISLYDKVIYTKEDVGIICDYRFLGNMTDKKYKEQNLATLVKSLTLKKYLDLTIISAKKKNTSACEIFKELQDGLKEINISYIDGFIEDSNTIQEITDSSNTLICIESGKSTIEDIMQMELQLSVLNSNIVGYIIC